MAENKTKPTAVDPRDFLATIADEKQRTDCAALVDLMREVTGEPPVMWGDSIIGFGKYAYKYGSGRAGEWPLTGVSPRKDSLTLYFCYYLGEQAAVLARLGKHKTGKGCLYIKRLSDVDETALRELVAAATCRPDA